MIGWNGQNSEQKDSCTLSPGLFLFSHGEELEQRVRVKSKIIGHPKDFCQLLIVLFHGAAVWWLFHILHDVKNVLNTLECILPQKKSSGSGELLEASSQLILQCVVGESNKRSFGVFLWIPGILLDGCVVLAQHVRNFLELMHLVIVLAESESSESSIVVSLFKSSIVLQNVHDVSACLVRKFDPRREIFSVCAIVKVLSSDMFHHFCLNGL
mmetsp:Transcript_4729/g.17751  ORF Transcript_4729/g.17751 Transcript_4729/m.17751 type:complete len:212 (-) Transcript_4729:406-1041(-)